MPLHVAVLKKDFATAEVLLKAGANANDKDNYGYTPLHYAVALYAVATAEVLLKAGADPNEKDFRGHTPLYDALQHNDPAMVEGLSRYRARR